MDYWSRASKVMTVVAVLLAIPISIRLLTDQTVNMNDANAHGNLFYGRTDLVWLAGNASGLGATFVAAYLMPSHGLFWAYATVASRLLLYGWSARARWGVVFRELLPLGLVAGFLELFADYFLVHWTRSGQLVYPTPDTVLLASPLYMPFAWACVIVEFGYLLLRLTAALHRTWVGAAIGGALAARAIGLYEYFAARAGWWYYKPAHAMLGKTCALYIPLGEFLMFATFPYIFRSAAGDTDWVQRALKRGTLFGAAIGLAYVVGYAALEVR